MSSRVQLKQYLTDLDSLQVIVEAEQGQGNIALYNNLFVNSHGDAVHIQPHNEVPRSIDVFYNTILASGAGVAIRHREGGSPPEQQTVRARGG